jgi:hypothetical protein
VLLVQVPAPELGVVLGVGVVPVDGGRAVGEEPGGGADARVVAGAEERRHRHPRPVGVDDGAVPHAPVPAVAQRLCRCSAVEASGQRQRGGERVHASLGIMGERDKSTSPAAGPRC